MKSTYEPPQLTVLGSFSELTLQKPGGPIPDGNDPCRFNNPRGVYKQTGTSDFIQGNAALQTCALTLAS